MATGLGLVAVLVVITLRTLAERESGDAISEALNTSVYVEGLFFAAIAVGIAVGLYIVTRAGD
jgi:hypothetical protein